MKNEIFLITFLLIVFFSLGDNNINYRNIKASDMHWENASNKMLAVEKSNDQNPKLDFRKSNYYKNDEYIAQVKNEIKKLSKEISDLKVDADLSKKTVKKDFLNNLLLMTSNTREPDGETTSFSDSSEPKDNKFKNQNEDIDSFDRVSNTPENRRGLMSSTVEP